MAPKRFCQLFGALNPEIDSITLDSGYRGLRNTGGGGEFILAHTLDLSNDSHRLSDGNLDLTFCFPILAHVISFDNHGP